MIGGIFTSFILELLVYPVIYETWKWHFEVKKSRQRIQNNITDINSASLDID